MESFRVLRVPSESSGAEQAVPGYGQQRVGHAPASARFGRSWISPVPPARHPAMLKIPRMIQVLSFGFPPFVDRARTAGFGLRQYETRHYLNCFTGRFRAC